MYKSYKQMKRFIFMDLRCLPIILTSIITICISSSYLVTYSSAASTANSSNQIEKRDADAMAKADWRASVREFQPTKAGCFITTFPSKETKAISCGSPASQPPRKTPKKQVFRPLDEKSGGDYVMTSQHIINSASGSLTAIENVTSVVGFTNVQNEFNLQLNTQASFPGTAAGSLCAQSKNANCTGWLQFVYDSGGSINIQSWALNYASTCPTSLPLSGPQNSCGKRTAIYNFKPPLWKLWDLAGAVLEGQIYKNTAGISFDKITFVKDNIAYSVVGPDVTGAFGNWSKAEFNVFGNSGGDESVFNSGSLISVSLDINSDPSGTAFCGGLVQGFTGETTNLTLMSCSANDNPGISFNEGVAPAVASISPNSGPTSGGTPLTIAAGSTSPNGTAVINGFNSNAVVKFGSNSAKVQNCTNSSCSVISPPGSASADVIVANVFKNGSLGPSSAATPSDAFTYYTPLTCNLTVGGCSSEGQQSFTVTCPTEVSFSLGNRFEEAGTSYAGIEPAEHQIVGVTACVPGTTNCDQFTTSATLTCPIHPVPVPSPPLKNCIECIETNRQCVHVTGGYQCKGLAQ